MQFEIIHAVAQITIQPIVIIYFLDSFGLINKKNQNPQVSIHISLIDTSTFKIVDLYGLKIAW